MRIRALAISLAAVLALGTALVAAVLLQPLPGDDIAELNDLRARAESAWPRVDADSFPEDAPPLTVIDTDGEILFSDAPALQSELSAARAGAHVFPVRANDEVVGMLFVENSAETVMQDQRRTALTITVAVFTAVALVLAAGLLRLWLRVLRPFHRLRGFARELARGNLDSPLPMDRGNAFGAFTESFDLMRSELRRARESERRAREENRETLAQIGHDIRTPVAVIAASSEVLGLGETDPDRLARLETISSRTEQLGRLLDDLVATSANDLGALSVATVPATSGELAELIRGCDAESVIMPFTVPECVVEVDPERMRQVIDNLLSNARKFAGTPVTLTAVIVETDAGSARRDGWLRALRLVFSDAGPGVSEQDLAVILAQGVRGSNAADVPGSGLGLFIAARLMEQMGGELAVGSRAAVDGSSFTVSLLLPLSGDDPRP